MQRFGARLIDLAGQLRSSYGFLPMLMSLLAALLAVLALLPPESWGEAVAAFLHLPPAPDAEALRDLLTLVASATISTGAVAFSVIVAASVTASSQYGPRLLTNFLADRATQATLGVFVATFVYCVIVYAAIRDDRVHSFAGLGAMAFAFLAVAALVFFLHHAPAALRINQAVSNIGATLLRNVETRFPGNCGLPVLDTVAAANAYAARDAPTVPLTSVGAGFLSIIDGLDLAELAAKAGVIVDVHVQVGEFITTGQHLADLHGPAPEEHVRDHMREQFALAKVRTPPQDNRFLADELVEIALRALSPGINDPVTAAACLHWLGAALGRMAAADPPSPYRGGNDHQFRVYIPVIGFETTLHETFGRIRRVAASSLLAAEAYLRSLAVIAVEGGLNQEAMKAVRSTAEAFMEETERELVGADLNAVRRAAEHFREASGNLPAKLDKFEPVAD